MSHWRTLRTRIASVAGAMKHQQVSRRVSATMRIFFGVRYPWRNVEKKRCALTSKKRVNGVQLENASIRPLLYIGVRGWSC